MGELGIVKGLVLSSVFVYCYASGQELTVSELLNADQKLSSHYGRRPHVLSNTLRRYYKLGLLCRRKEPVRGHPYRYNLTRKGFMRLYWMFFNSEKYLYRGKDDVKPLGPLILEELKKIRDDRILKRIKRIVDQMGKQAKARYMAKP
jgi:hypothetical protein